MTKFDIENYIQKRKIQYDDDEKRLSQLHLCARTSLLFPVRFWNHISDNFNKWRRIANAMFEAGDLELEKEKYDQFLNAFEKELWAIVKREITRMNIIRSSL